MQTLIDVYGPAACSGLGSAVFTVNGVTPATLEAVALDQYRRFVGGGWDKRASAWLGGFKELYRRASGDAGVIDMELRAIKDPALRGVVAVMIDDMVDPAVAHAALAGAFDGPGVRDMRLYALGDGEQMAGVQVASLAEGGEAVFLIMLLD
jgi:hypothetical protein